MSSLPPLQGSLNLLLVVSVTNTSFTALLTRSLLLLLYNGFHDSLHAILLDGWVAGSVFLLLVDGLPTVRVPYCLTAGTTAGSWAHPSPPLVNDFANVPHAIDYSPNRSFLRAMTAFTTVWMPYCSVDGSGLLILPLIKGFHDGLRAVLLSGWQHLAASSARQWLFRRFTRHIAQRMAAHCSYFHSSKAFTKDCAPYCSPDGSALVILLLINGFSDGLRAVLLS